MSSQPQPKLIQDVRAVTVKNDQPRVLGLSGTFQSRRQKTLDATQTSLTIDEGLNETGLKIAPRHDTKRGLKLTWGFLQYPLLAAIAILAAYSAAYGQVFIAAYVVYAIVRRQSPRLSFGLALFLLLCVALFLILSQLSIAQTAAIYVFELLVFGILQTFLERYFTGKNKEVTE